MQESVGVCGACGSVIACCGLAREKAKREESESPRRGMYTVLRTDGALILSALRRTYVYSTVRWLVRSLEVVYLR